MLTLNKKLLTFFLSRFFFSCVAFFFFSRFTTQLGDTTAYLNTGLVFTKEIFWSSTYMMYFLGGLLKKIFYFDILTCIPFCLLVTFSYRHILNYFTQINKKQKLILSIVFYLPSFGIWTSICSKESISVFYFSIIGVFLCKVLDKKVKYPNRIELFCLYLCLIFKPLLFIPVIQFYSIFLIIRKSRIILLSYITILIILNIAIVYNFIDEINLFVNNIFNHFASGNTSRENIWINDNDFIWKFYVAMPLSFIGPVLSDIIKKPSQIIFTIESLILIYVLFIPSFSKVISLNNKFPIYLMLISFIASLIYFNSFQGALNPGSGLRYRDNIIIIITIMILYIKKNNQEFIKSQ